jgi:2-polyprenyl-3-methyl-5-hydroxy-6-metoxy-1,4-benzoquinol methylase
MVDETRPFTDADARAAWNTGAQAWNEFVESGADYYRHEVHGPALLAMCEPVAGLHALDLGCGQGFFTRELARRGARVTGVDISEEQIAFARQHEAREPLGIEYRIVSATEVSAHWPDGCFDLVTACMSLHDMAGVGAVLKGAFAVLRTGGRMVFSVPHPFTSTPVREWERDEAGNQRALKIDRYFDSGPGVCHWSMQRLTYHWDAPTWRYTLAGWSQLVAEAGFLIRRLDEPRLTEEQIQRNPNLEDCYRLPAFLIFELVNCRGGATDS